MHVTDAKEITKRGQKNARKKGRIFRYYFFALLIVGLAGAGWWYVQKNILPVKQPALNAQEKPAVKTKLPPVATPTPKTKLKIFTGEQFKDLYHSIIYPNTEPFSTPPEITGNLAADERIRSMAQKRGFVMTSIPVAPIEKTNEPQLAGETDDLLQPLALRSWQALKQAAKADGVKITLISAYRSPKWQRDLFMQRLLAHGVTVDQIAAGKADNAVNDTLGMTAVPGFSRHHTGYTVDMYCEDGAAFGNSVCNTWISKNNYENAKKYGWIPSYPPGANEQGPEPEPWEFVWVGTDVLYE